MKKLLVLLLAGALLAGCSSTSTPEATETPAVTATPEVTAAPETTETPETPEVSALQATIGEIVSADETLQQAQLQADSAVLEQLFYLDSTALENIADYAVYSPFMNTAATEVIVLEAVEGQVSVAEEVIEKRLVDLDANWSTYLPDQYELVKNATVITEGNYVIMVVSHDSAAVAETIVSSLTTEK